MACSLKRNFALVQFGSLTTCSADGTFFIDRNAKTFKYILDSLRTVDMLVESGDSNVRLQLPEDAEFFELPEELEENLRFSCLVGMDLSFSVVRWPNNELPSQLKLGAFV